MTEDSFSGAACGARNGGHHRGRASPGTGAAAPAKKQAGFSAGLVSDVGRFNDKGFNQNQLTGPEVRPGQARRARRGDRVALVE